MLRAVCKLAKGISVLTLVLWGLALMHCRLEAVPGVDFLKSCCSAKSASAVPPDCLDDECDPVENGKYRSEEPAPAIPQPVPVLVRLLPEPECSLPVLRAASVAAAESPPARVTAWQFAHRTALPPRAPSPTS